MKNFTKIELDALHEFINIGTGRAATALSELIDKKVSIKVPEIKIVPISQVPGLLGGPEIPVVGLYFKIMGDLSGSILLFFDFESSNQLANFLTAGIADEKTSGFEEIKESALMEAGNILTNSYLNALSDMMDNKILLSVPSYASDMLGAVIDIALIEIAQNADNALLMKTEIDSPGTKLNGSFVIFPDNESFEKIFNKIGIE